MPLTHMWLQDAHIDNLEQSKSLSTALAESHRPYIEISLMHSSDLEVGTCRGPSLSLSKPLIPPHSHLNFQPVQCASKGFLRVLPVLNSVLEHLQTLLLVCKLFWSLSLFLPLPSLFLCPCISLYIMKGNLWSRLIHHMVFTSCIYSKTLWWLYCLILLWTDSANLGIFSPRKRKTSW